MQVSHLAHYFHTHTIYMNVCVRVYRGNTTHALRAYGVY